MGEGPLLDVGHQNCTRYLCHDCAKFRRRKGRSYQRAMSGLKVHPRWQMWTLTTSRESVDLGIDIRASFRALVMRMRRRSLINGYFKVIEYTKQGWPHIHVLIAGPPIPHWWMSETWAAIHHSPNVWYSKERSALGAAGYLAKYMGKDPRARYSWAWDWVWKGFAKDWRNLVADGFRQGETMIDIIGMWDAILDRFGLSALRDG